MENKCVVCNEIIPEGRQVCPNCDVKATKSRKILALYSQGVKNPYVIAQKIGCPVTSVQSILCQNGIRRRRPKKNYKKTEINIMAKAILFDILTTKKTISQIAREYGVSRQYVSHLKIKELCNEGK